MRLIDADALLERIKKDPLFPLVEEYGISGVIKAEPTVEAFPLEWFIDKYTYATEDILKDWESYLKEQAERRETEDKKTCYNCKHGAYGFDGDLGCSLWNHGIADPLTCGSWKGGDGKEE